MPSAPTATPVPVPLSVQGIVSQSFQYDTNPLLTDTGVKAVFGSITQPEVILTGATSVLRLDWDTKLDIRQFDAAHFSSNDVHTTATGTAIGEVTFAKLAMTFDYDTTQTSELLTSGVNVAGIRHTGLTVAPELGAILTETDQFIVDGSFQEGIYADTRIFTNFQSLTLDPSFVHNFTTEDAGSVIVQASHFATTTGAPGSDDSIGGGLGWQRHFSERLLGSISGGGNWNESATGADGPFTPAVSKSTIGYFYNVGLDFTGELDKIHAAASRGLLPEGVSVEAVQTSLNLAETHAFTPNLSATVSASYQKNSYTGAEVGNAAAFFGGASGSVETDASLQYRLTESLAVSPSFRYRDKDFVNGSPAAASEAVVVTFVFTPHPAALGW
jgi:hypothetical protein